MQIASVAGRRIRYVEAGDAAADRVLVLLHAFPLGPGMFERQQEAFDGSRIVMPALPGFDGSDLLDELTADAYAKHIIALLDQLRIERAVVGGVSLGGYVTFSLLRLAPERVAALILADTRSAADTDEARAGRRRLLQTVHSEGRSGVVAEMLTKLLGKTSLETRPELALHVRRLIEKQSEEGIAAAVHVLMSRPDSTPLLSLIRVPTLVIAGEEDVLTTPAEMERMASAIAGARFVRLQGAGHLSNLETSEPFNREVNDFLQMMPEA
jgi:3-oxoadipate enol-lactonase